MSTSGGKAARAFALCMSASTQSGQFKKQQISVSGQGFRRTLVAPLWEIPFAIPTPHWGCCFSFASRGERLCCGFYAFHSNAFPNPGDRISLLAYVLVRWRLAFA